MKLLVIAAVLLIAGCSGKSGEVAKSVAELQKKCTKPLQVTFTYSPGLFNDGSLTVHCSEVMP